MPDVGGPNVGRRIRAVREQRNLSLRALADRCSLSVNAISLIERGQNSPTVASLHQLATALGVPITDFFQGDHERDTVLVRKDQRLVYEKGGLIMESLGLGISNQQLEPFLVRLEADSGSDEPITHPGQEFVHCLAGELVYCIAGTSYTIKQGDSLLFKASHPHSFINKTEAPTTFLLVFQTAECGHLARESHLDVE